jgi:hypothetical protein
MCFHTHYARLTPFIYMGKSKRLLLYVRKWVEVQEEPIKTGLQRCWSYLKDHGCFTLGSIVLHLSLAYQMASACSLQVTRVTFLRGKKIMSLETSRWDHPVDIWCCWSWCIVVLEWCYVVAFLLLFFFFFFLKITMIIQCFRAVLLFIKI